MLKVKLKVSRQERNASSSLVAFFLTCTEYFRRCIFLPTINVSSLQIILTTFAYSFYFIEDSEHFYEAFVILFLILKILRGIRNISGRINFFPRLVMVLYYKLLPCDPRTILCSLIFCLMSFPNKKYLC